MKDAYKKLNVIVVDDENTSRVLLAETIKSMGINKVLSLSCGMDGLEEIIKKVEVEGDNLDYIFSDYQMPDMDGIRLFEELKKLGLLSNTKFILVSDKMSQSNINEILGSGISNILTKPVTVDSIEKIFEEE